MKLIIPGNPRQRWSHAIVQAFQGGEVDRLALPVAR
jgi:hypothetical protein